MRRAGPTAAGDGANGLLAAALRSDRLYFEAGARVTGTENFTLATVPGSERLAAGNVGFLERWPGTGPALDVRLRQIEALFRAADAAAIRFYGPGAGPEVSRRLSGLGYCVREETIHVRHAGGDHGFSSRLTMFPIRTESDWARKLELQRSSDLPSDGHACDPAEWVAFERIKCARSDLTFYGFEDDSGMVASMGFLPVSGRIVRFKNLLVRGEARRSGVGREVIRLSFRHAFKAGSSCVILFAIAGTSGDRIYREAGAGLIGSVYEYSRAMEP